jgi:hypothetical protein
LREAGESAIGLFIASSISVASGRTGDYQTRGFVYSLNSNDTPQVKGGAAM